MDRNFITFPFGFAELTTAVRRQHRSARTEARELRYVSHQRSDLLPVGQLVIAAQGARQVFGDQPCLAFSRGVEDRDFAHADFPAAKWPATCLRRKSATEMPSFRRLSRR
jgi:hypothetical protein